MVAKSNRDNPASALSSLVEFASREQLETADTYFALLEQVNDLLCEQPIVQVLTDVPTIVLPDLHARRALLMNVLSARLHVGPYAGEQIFALLAQGRINVVCVGDIMHSEERSDWVTNADGEWSAELLDKEMVRSLGAGALIMSLKLQHPNHFHCLRGNHDDMLSKLGMFRKYVGIRRDEKNEVVIVDGRPLLTGEKGEPEIIRDWLLAREEWGESFLAAWAQFERSLPLLALGTYYAISHTLPRRPLTAEELYASKPTHDLSRVLTMSRGIDEVAIVETLINLDLAETIEHWFYGHTPVANSVNDGKYEIDMNGFAVRLNNSRKHVFAYVPAGNEDECFEPDKHVFVV